VDFSISYVNIIIAVTMRTKVTSTGKNLNAMQKRGSMLDMQATAVSLYRTEKSVS